MLMQASPPAAANWLIWFALNSSSCIRVSSASSWLDFLHNIYRLLRERKSRAFISVVCWSYYTLSIQVGGRWLRLHFGQYTHRRNCIITYADSQKFALSHSWRDSCKSNNFTHVLHLYRLHSFVASAASNNNLLCAYLRCAVLWYHAIVTAVWRRYSGTFRYFDIRANLGLKLDWYCV